MTFYVVELFFVKFSYKIFLFIYLYGLGRFHELMGRINSWPALVYHNYEMLINDLFYFADVDECADHNGGCTSHSTCKNTVGSYSCVCDTGYRAEGSRCVG